MGKKRSNTKSDQGADKPKDQKREVKYLLSQLREAKKHIKRGRPFNASNILTDVARRLTTPVSSQL